MTSRACVLHGIHDLRLETQSEPVAGPGEVKVSILAGGICGSDLHYFDHGGFGPVRVREPIAMGHEAAGRVVETGSDVDTVQIGDLVAINPSQPCGHCPYCKEGSEVHCLDMRFMGSAYRLPHEQGLFRERVVVPAKQATASTGMFLSARPHVPNRLPSACMRARRRPISPENAFL